MFSEEDIQSLCRLIPPHQVLASNNPGLLDSFPPLLVAKSEHGLVTQQHAYREIRNIITIETQRIPIPLLTRQLDLDSSIIIQFVEAIPSLALLSEDRLDIIPKSQRDALEAELQSLVLNQAISKPNFLRDHHIDSIDSLLGADQGLTEVNGYLISTTYFKALEDEIQNILKVSIGSLAPVELRTNSLPGSPPLWLISQTITGLLRTADTTDQWDIEESSDLIRCILRESVLRNSEEEINKLRNGSIAYIDLQQFARKFSKLYPTLREIENHLSGCPGVTIEKPYAISETWLADVVGQSKSKLENKGYADLARIVEDDLPTAVQGKLYQKSEELLLGPSIQQGDQATPTAQSGGRRVGRYILTIQKYDDERISLLQAVGRYASREWDLLNERPDSDIKFQLSRVMEAISSDEPLLHVLMETKDIQKAADLHFWSEISNLEAKNEADLSTFWNDRVVSRARNYLEGLTAVEDTKLRDQLSDLLSTYLQKELLPESIAKARTQGLIRSRRSKKNIQKLESISKSSITDAAGAVAMIEKFCKKQGIPDLDSAALAEAKSTVVKDMGRRVRKKQSDGPILFLTLVIVLLAKNNAGVVYATGKFAPKLMKQLKSSLDAEQYAQLEKWKEAAKAGTLTPEDKDKMRENAA
ncbi:hypothetical protein CC78DRAFT_615946 [Lojkania enalia]|uniref:Uncharacterized protein n=1 Tax=Lojkania enalia TaxID=147567 RepID=A0A9P4KBX9_9PLEO|nr:hypothetical protein CC78DRAFT_615946 [Didymosphaeria enalia]